MSGLDSGLSQAKDPRETSDRASRKLAEIEQMCCASGDSFDAGQWCEAAGIALEIARAYGDALARISLGIGGRQEAGLLPNEGEDYLPTMPKPDWKLAREAIDA